MTNSTNRITNISWALTASLLAVATTDPFEVYAGGSPRHEASMLAGKRTATGFQKLGRLSINHGLPDWKPEYDARFDEMTRGRIWRLGTDAWTTLDSNVPLVVGGVAVPEGIWYLGIARSREGAWSLAVIDPAKARAKRILAESIDQAPRDFEAPLTHARLPEGSVPRPEVTLTAASDGSPRATLAITWGSHRLTATVEMKL